MAERNFTLKTVEEFIDEIKGSAALRSELKAIKDKYALERFLQNNDCGASADDFANYVKSKSEGELDDDAAENVAGGYPIFAY